MTIFLLLILLALGSGCSATGANWGEFSKSRRINDALNYQTERINFYEQKTAIIEIKPRK